MENLYTNDDISGINFNQWYKNSVWKTGRDIQHVTANWTINDAIIRSSIDGNGDFNGLLIESLSQRIFNHTPQIEGNLQEFHKSYQEVCNTLTSLVDNTQKDLYILSHFDIKLKIQESLPISSFYYFTTNNREYLAINFGCMSKLYIWNAVQIVFNYVCEFSSGIVDQFIHVIDTKNNWYLISNSAINRKKCNESGLNIWKFNGSSIIHFPSKLDIHISYNSIQRNYHHMERFYALQDENNTVYDYDLHGNIVEKWNLPSHGDKFRFIPNEANLGLALSDGHLLTVLSSIKPRFERTSQWIDNLPDEFNQEKNITKRLFFSDNTNAQIQSAREKYVLSQQAKLKAMSLAGPFTNISIGKNLEFFNDILGNRPKNEFASNKGVHLKIEPTENLQQSNRPYYERLFDNQKLENENNFPDVKNVSLNSNDLVLVHEVTDQNKVVTGGPVSSDSIVGDIFGNLEELSKQIGDELVDISVDLNSDTDGGIKHAIDDLVDIGESVYQDYQDSGGFLGGQNVEILKQENSTKNLLIAENNHDKENDAKDSLHSFTTYNTIIGDTFGALEELSKQIGDELTDNVFELDGETDGAVAGAIDSLIDFVEPLYEDYHESGKFLGSIMPQAENSITTNEPIVGDAFGELEELSKRIGDDLVDTMVELDSDTNGVLAGLVDGAVDIAEELYQDYHDEGGFLGSTKLNYSDIAHEPNNKDSKLSGTFGDGVNKIKNTISHGYHKSKDYIQHKLHHSHNKSKSDEHIKLNDHSTHKNESVHNNTSHHNLFSHLHHHRQHLHSDARTNTDEIYQEKPDEYVRTINTELPPSKYSDYISNQNESTNVVNSFPHQYSKDHFPTIPRIKIDNIQSLGETLSSLQFDGDKSTSTTTVPSFIDHTISKEIMNGGLVTAENEFFPGYGKQEIVVLKIGNNGKTFVAVSSHRENMVQGLHDSILVSLS